MKLAFEVSVEAKCYKCDRDLTIIHTHQHPRGNVRILSIVPCEQCMGEAESEGYDDGKRES